MTRRLRPFRCHRSVWDRAPSVLLLVLLAGCGEQDANPGASDAAEVPDLVYRLSHDPSARGVIESLRKRVAADPGNASAHLQFAEALTRFNIATEAVHELRRVLELDPENERARSLLIDAALFRGDVDEGRREVDAGLAQKETAALRVAAAKLDLADKPARPDSAETNLRRALALEPNHVDATYQLALVRLMQDDATTAVPLLRAVAARDPRHLGARFNLARALRKLGATDEADAVAAEHRRLSHLEDLGHLDQPNGVDACLALAQMYAAGNDLESALPEIDRAVEAAPADPMPWIVKGRILGAAGRVDEAADAFESGLLLGPEDPRLLNEYAWHLATRCDGADRRRKALKLAELAARVTKNRDANVLDTLAVVRAKNGDRAGALAAIDAALRIDPANAAFKKRRSEFVASGSPPR